MNHTYNIRNNNFLDTGKNETKKKCILREPLSGLTHFIGIVLGITGTYFLVKHSSHASNIPYLVYGTALTLLYTASTLYHWLPLSPAGIKRLRKVDHASINLMIAGTYTPLTIYALKGKTGFLLLFIIWSLALIGIFFRLFWMNAPRKLYVGFYIMMGWVAVIFIYPLAKVLHAGGLMWLLGGGLAYSFGAFLYAIKKPNPFPGVFGFHEIWHLFVLAGSAFHYVLIWFYT